MRIIDWSSDVCSSDLVASAIADADARVRLLRNERNLGVAATRNHALEVARGRYVAFLDSDDRWLPGKLQLQIAAMDAAGAAASYGTYQRVAEDGRCLNLVVPPASLSHRDMLKSNRIGHSTGIYDRHAVGDGARFQPTGPEDYAFWLHLPPPGEPEGGAGGTDPRPCHPPRKPARRGK